MIPYIFLILFYFLFLLVENILNSLRKKGLYRVFLVLPIWCLMSFRSVEVGTDSPTYLAIYEGCSDEVSLLAFLAYSMEPTYLFLCYICSSIGISFYGVNTIIATINCCAFSYLFKKYSYNIAFSWLLYINLLFFARSMNISREMLAVALSVFTITFILNRKFILFVIATLLLTLVHKTAIFLLLLPALLSLKDRTKRYIICIIASLVFYFLFSSLMNLFVRLTGKYAYLIDSQYTSSEGGYAMLATLLFAILSFFLWKNSILKNSINIKNHFLKYDLWEAMLLCSIVFGFGGLKFGLADRAALYFSVAYLIVIPNLVRLMKINKRFRMSLVWVVFTSSYFISVMIFRNNWHSIVPYMFYWE